MTSLETQIVSPDRYSAWNDLVEQSPEGSIYSQPDYLAALCDAAGGTFRVAAIARGGALVGGAALYETQSILHGRIAAPRRLLYYHGPVLERYSGTYPSQGTARQVEVLSQLADFLRDLDYDSIALKSPSSLRDVRPFLERGWRAAPTYTYVVPLSDLRSQWEKVEGNLRRLITRCQQRDGVTFSDDADFDSFYRLHAMTMERRSADTYLPQEPFRRYFARLHGAGLARLFHARHPDGSVIASQLVLLGRNRTCHTVCAGMDPAFGRLGASAFLRWKSFEALAELGYQANDLTDAALNSVTHFKSQFGGALECPLVVNSPRSLRNVAGTQCAGIAARARGIAARIASTAGRALGR